MSGPGAPDGGRLWADLEETSGFGGTDDGGLHRLAGSTQDGRVRDWLVARLGELGARVRVDEVGNVFGRIGPGDDGGDAGDTPRALLVGSHLDSQPHAGRYDGVYGVLAGLEALRCLQGEDLGRPIELVCWTNEEGARFAPAMMGSAVFAGALDPAEALDTTDADGTTLGDALARIGYRGTDVVTPAEFAAYLEIHIEQGPVLERDGLDLAVVTGVQAIHWLRVTVRGNRGHAGTTPMEGRSDALVAAARCVLAVDEVGRSRPGLGRATVGTLDVADAAPNVVPDHVGFTVELRHPSDVPAMAQQAREAMAREAEREGCDVEIETVLDAPPVVFDPAIVGHLHAVLENMGRPPAELVSGAGHDACRTAPVIPTAMLFIPCVGGVSHAPQERITREWSDAGVDALVEAVRRVCGALDGGPGGAPGGDAPRARGGQ